MSNHLAHQVHLSHKALEGISHTDKPLEGAGYGAIAAGSSVPLILAGFGLALTPVGWIAALSAGAAAGAAYVANKKKG